MKEWLCLSVALVKASLVSICHALLNLMKNGHMLQSLEATDVLPVTSTFLVMSHMTHFSSAALKPALALHIEAQCTLSIVSLLCFVCEHFSSYDNSTTWSLNRMSAGNILTQTSKGGDMDSWIKQGGRADFNT